MQPGDELMSFGRIAYERVVTSSEGKLWEGVGMPPWGALEPRLREAFAAGAFAVIAAAAEHGGGKHEA